MSKYKEEKKQAERKAAEKAFEKKEAETEAKKAAETAKAETSDEDNKADDAKADDAKNACENDIPDTISLSRAEFDKVKAHIEKLQKDKDDAVSIAQRIQADFDNYRRRNASLQADSMDEGSRNVVKELLPVIDNFDRALMATDGVDENYLSGIKLVYKQLMTSLTKCGMEEIPAEGKFDPQLHNAVLQEEKEDCESGEIIEVLQKGYKVKERIIRHSMVKVAK